MHLISPNDRVGRKIDHSRNKSFYCRICGAGFDKSDEWKKHVLDDHQSKGECQNGDHPFFLNPPTWPEKHNQGIVLNFCPPESQ